MLLWSITPADQIRFINCALKNNLLRFARIGTEGIVYPPTELLFDGTEWQEENPVLVRCSRGRNVKLRIVNSKNTDVSSAVQGNVQILQTDISLERKKEENQP